MELVDYCHPKVLQDDLVISIVNIGKEHLSLASKQKLEVWLKFISSIPGILESDQNIIKRFLQVIQNVRVNLLDQSP